MRHFALLAAASALALAVNSVPAAADGCSGHDHDTGTIVGGVGGAAIGGLASGSVVGAVAGGVVGALAGNAIARSEDCDHQARADAGDRHDAYEAGRDDQAYRDSQRQAAVNDADRHDAYQAGRDDQAATEADTRHDAYQNGRDDQAVTDAGRQERQDSDDRTAGRDAYPR